MMQQASYSSPDEQGYSVATTCNQTRPFLCPSPRASQERFLCISFDQIGDQHVDCAGAIDESNTLEHCSLPSTMLGHNFRCLSTNTCIPYSLHCWNNNRCPNRSDDEHWCSRFQPSPPEGISPRDALCFNGFLFEGGRCNKYFQCPFWEDEYMCDYLTFSQGTSVPYREQKESRVRSASNTLRLSRYPPDGNVTLLKPDSIGTTQSRNNGPSSSSSLSPFWCNRGLGALLSNGSIVCFCPPHYFGDKCQYQTNRVSLVLSLDLSQSIYHRSDIDPTILLKVLVLFLFNNQTLMRHQFHLRPALDVSSSTQKKMTTHFLYSQSAWFRHHRLQRHHNRSNLINTHPHSIHIELYETRRSEPPARVGVWRYPIYFDDLPVFRLAKVLRLPRSADHRNPCLSSPCDADREECHSLINDPHSNFVCLCKANFTGENCSEEDSRCLHGYCAPGSLCMSNYRSLLRGDDSPLCLCPSDRYGDQCSIEHDGCLSSPCLNNGSCFPASQLDQVMCVCTKEYFGPKCEWKRSHLRLSIVESSSHTGAVIQYFHLDSTSLDLILVHQQVFQRFPRWIEFYDDQSTIPAIVLAKLYSSFPHPSPELYVLSSHENTISVDGTTDISQINRCPHLHTFSNGNLHLDFSIA